jgi:hypothetical protein
MRGQKLERREAVALPTFRSGRLNFRWAILFSQFSSRFF